MNPLRKYIDRDVQEDPALMEYAVSYARAYSGDFPFMRDAQSMALRTGSLTLGVARGVLNCARLDPRWAEVMPEPKEFVAPVLDLVRDHDDDDDDDEYDDYQPRSRSFVRRASEPRRPYTVFPTARWAEGVLYAASLHKSAFRYHLLDGDPVVRYWTSVARPYHERFDMHFRVLCKRAYNEVPLRVPPEGYSLCPTCERLNG